MNLSLKRRIGLFGATSYGVGMILGAGIYSLIGPAAGIAGNTLWISFIIGAIVSSFTGLSYAELSTMFPKTAAEFIYTREAFRSESLAFLTGWLTIISGIISASTVALGFANYFGALFGYPTIPIVLGLIALLSLLNFIGIEQSSRVNILFTAVEMAGLFLIIFLGVGKFGAVNYLEYTSFSGIFAAAALMFFAYLGFEDIVNMAEETKNPEKTLPKALILSVLITTTIYVLVALSTVSLVNWRILGESSAPLAYAASTVLGNNAFLIMSYIALFATANTVLIIMIVSSRMIYGMAKEGALPNILSRVHFRTRTPWLAIFLVMALSMLFALLGDIELVAGMTSFGVLVSFVFVNLSLAWLRYKKPDLKRPFKVPINIGKFPVVSVLGLASCLFMLTQFDLNVVLFGTLVVSAGIIVQRLHRRQTHE